jgi:hypothetical protein
MYKGGGLGTYTGWVEIVALAIGLVPYPQFG